MESKRMDPTVSRSTLMQRARSVLLSRGALGAATAHNHEADCQQDGCQAPIDACFSQLTRDVHIVSPGPHGASALGGTSAYSHVQAAALQGGGPGGSSTPQWAAIDWAVQAADEATAGDPAALLRRCPPSGLAVSAACARLVRMCCDAAAGAIMMAHSRRQVGDKESLTYKNEEDVQDVHQALSAVRDCLELYLSIVPLQLSQHSATPSSQNSADGTAGAQRRAGHTGLKSPSLPRTDSTASMMMYHNDCWYLAQCASRIAGASSPFLPSTSTPPVCSDLMAVFMECAQRAYVDAVVRVTQDAHAIFNEAPTLESSFHADGEAALLSCARTQSTYIQSVAQGWKDVLSYPHYGRAVGYVMDSVLNRLCEGVLALESIDDRGGQALAGLLRHHMQCATLVLSSSSLPGPSTAYDPALYIRHWVRAGQLADVLEASPPTIRSWCDPGGPFDRIGGLSRGEAAWLVRALVADGPERDKVMQMLRTGAAGLPRGMVADLS